MEAPGNSDPGLMPVKPTSAVYVHIPFCRRQCYYCNFSKFIYDRSSEEKYTEYLCRELKLRKNKVAPIRTIYFGGGSPAVLTDSSLERIINAIHENFNTSDVSEMTVEINPEECSPGKLRFLRDSGFNRISIGVQSFSDKDLLYLSRNHDSEKAVEGLETALITGFNSVSADLIIGLPHQEFKTLEKNIRTLFSMGVDHLSAYLLEGVKEYGERRAPDAEHQSVLYNVFRERAGAAGYDQYEISNFCRDGKYSEHNLNYWEGGSYIGTGSSASGYENGIDYTNFAELRKYYGSIAEMNIPVADTMENEFLTRALVTGLRLVKGIDKNKFKVFKPKILELIEEGFLEEADNFYRVAPSKMVVLNEILSYLL